MDKISYALGLNIGQQLKSMGLKDSLAVDDFAVAVKDILCGNKPQMELAEVNNILTAFFAEVEERQKKAALADGEKFLKENGKRTEVTTTSSGLQYEVLKEGDGRQPKASDTVRCHYQGTLIDGTVFDSSYQRGEPCEFGLRQVIAGWTEGVQLMKEGAKYRFYIPHNLAYGERGAGDAIPPFSALIFDVELIKVL